jgi:natural product precursor
MKLEEINKEFQPIETSNVLSDEEMKDTLGGGDCKGGCKESCKDACKPGNRDGGSTVESLQER